MKPFDLQTDPLNGVTLIEAGAGTGKTYTLTGIFLRLVIERGLTVDQILVVTYTKAATEELKSRIRNGLLRAESAIAAGDSEDEFGAFLIDRVENPSAALHRIRDALTNFDRAAIFTIHGFCQRLLQQFAFETASVFNSNVVQDTRPFVQELADDFWRRHISRAPYELARYAVDVLRGPEQLAAVLETCRYPDAVVSGGIEKVALHAIRPWRLIAREALSLWREASGSVCRQLESPALYARPYGKVEPHPRRAGQSCRQVIVQELRSAMDRWGGRYPLIKEFAFFCRSYIHSHTRKGQTPPDHPFFDLCDQVMARHREMEAQMAAYVRYLKIRFFRTAERAMEAKKRRQNVLFFDDLLLLVHRALQGARGARLAAGVRTVYRSALVDEFQDTDPLQYTIFHRLFGQGDALLALIGDPKQAIYSFRGADLFSYLKAAREALTKATLTRNWRSTPGLVKAVNTIFSRHVRPFGFDQIDFRTATAAGGTAADTEVSPFTLWHLTRGDTDAHTRPVSQDAATERIAAAVADEICRLLTAEGADGPDPEQIAVLTRTHVQSQVIKKALADQGVPAVLHGAGSVFHTRDAAGLRQLLSAAAAPGDRVAANALLAGDYYDLNAQDFIGAESGTSDRWQRCYAALAHDHQTWVRQGFYVMFRQWMIREKIKSRLLALPDGERRLTNLNHLGELLHQAETANRLGLEALIKWLIGRMQSPGTGADDQQLRLESDSRAVRIVTMHKSKGLQFDVVFCPFVWSGVRADTAAAVFHDPRNDHALTLSIGPDIDADHLRQARREGLSETLRMLYVALTRARRRCYMVWGRINKADISAPAYLLHGNHDGAGHDRQVERLQERMNGLTDADFIADLMDLAHASEGAISVQPLPRASGCRHTPGVAAAGPLRSRKRKRFIQRDWRITSFSSLTAPRANDRSERPDHDEATRSAPEADRTAAPFTSLIDFPKGAHAGLFFHDLLEHWQHDETDHRRLSELARSKLTAHGFDRRWESTLVAFLLDLAKTVLTTQYDRFSLAQVRPADRINEMSFYYPIKAFGPGELSAAFNAAGHRNALEDQMRWQIGRLAFLPGKGVMKGYIDAVLRVNGRFYIVDWKSNYLGPDADDYRRDALERTMVQETYFLQYLLYSVAMDQLLRRKMADYAYERHFGGVLYLFLRGIAADQAGQAGVYAVLPDKGVIDTLRNTILEAAP